MRVRPQRLANRRPLAQRRLHAAQPPAEAAPAQEDPPPGDDHPAERRHRASVAPEDTAHYSCSCGFQFQAAVSTSVACPHCGTGQAW
jgi:hypothetical protein